MEKTIEQIIEKNIEMIGKGGIRLDPAVRSHAIRAKDWGTCITLTYDNHSGEIKYPMGDDNKSDFSQVMVEYNFRDSNIPYTLDLGSLKRLGDCQFDFGIAPGDSVIEQSIYAFNKAREEYQKKHKGE